tara:strand:+ start:93 stop:371 length:279 start_codon:yes stop_codon:yes gene_type:complete
MAQTQRRRRNRSNKSNSKTQRKQRNQKNQKKQQKGGSKKGGAKKGGAKKGGKPVNKYFQLMMNAKKHNLESFEYNGKTYKREKKGHLTFYKA